jgi:phage terminase large subunit
MTGSKVKPINVDFKPNPKQAQALKYLFDSNTEEVLYGGAAGGGKTYLGVAWCTTMCLRHPGVRYVIGRTILKTLKETTAKTLWKLLADWNLEEGSHYTYNATDGLITFYNKSEILLKDLADSPADPDFDSLGGLELTGAFIDEASQISQKCKSVLNSRIRHMLREYKLKGKLLMTCNPTRNFLYEEFYSPWKEGSLKPERKYIQAFYSDNPEYADGEYAQRIMNSGDNTQIERYLYGNWDYSTDDTALIDSQKILEIFTRTPLEGSGRHYITADIAGSGRDRTTIYVWKDFDLIDYKIFDKNTTVEAVEAIKSLELLYKVGRSDIIVDKIGIGSGVSDYLPNSSAFIAGAKAFNADIYINLKAECGYKLAELVNSGKITVSNFPFEHREKLIQELEYLRTDQRQLDGKKSLLSKDAIKKAIGRSPDFLDSLMFRAWFALVRRGSCNYGLQIL